VAISVCRSTALQQMRGLSLYCGVYFFLFMTLSLLGLGSVFNFVLFVLFIRVMDRLRVSTQHRSSVAHCAIFVGMGKPHSIGLYFMRIIVQIFCQFFSPKSHRCRTRTVFAVYLTKPPKSAVRLHRRAVKAVKLSLEINSHSTSRVSICPLHINRKTLA